MAAAATTIGALYRRIEDDGARRLEIFSFVDLLLQWAAEPLTAKELAAAMRRRCFAASDGGGDGGVGDPALLAADRRGDSGAGSAGSVEL